MPEPTQYAQWYEWAKTAIPEKRLRPYAIRAAVEAVNSGATPEAASDAAKAAVEASRPLAVERGRRSSAISSLVLFALGLVGLFSLIFLGCGLVAGIIGTRAQVRKWRIVAIVGIVLNALAIVPNLALLAGRIGR
jgi:hypothetical protein